MRDAPLPADLQRRWGHLPDLQFRGGNEWSSSCPQCGGAGNRRDPSDRFRLFAGSPGHDSRGWCRQCSFFAWATDDQRPSTPEEIADAQKERIRHTKLDQQRLKDKINALRHDAYWLGYHDGMKERHRSLWRDQGINDDLQDYFQLGYIKQRRFFNGAAPFYTPAMTIPVFDVGWEAINVQYRLMDPPTGVGKYRFTHGFPTPLFITNPYTEPEGPTLLVEGAKKGIVCFNKLDLYVVAVPSKAPPVKLLKQLDKCDPVYIALDPDAYDEGKFSAAARCGKILGSRARYVRLPVKPDDFFTLYNGKKEQFMSYVKQATRSIQ